MTMNLFNEIAPSLVDREDGTEFTVRDIEEMNRGHWQSLRRIITSQLRSARDTADPGSEPGVHFTLPSNIWLILNENGGWTLMLPSDY
jgi:hypothetical protein